MMLIDGVATEQVDASDRGLNYGDGLFETIAVVDGRLRFWPQHMARLAEGARRLRLPGLDEAVLRREAEQLAQGVERGVLKIVITRGSGGRGYRLPVPCQPRRLLRLYPWPDYPVARPQAGVAVRICETRLACNPLLAGIKHLNRLEQVLARAEWDDPGIVEGLMQDMTGNVIEGTMSNLFLVQGQHLVTPALDRCGVAGIMRQHLLELAQTLGMVCEVRPVSVAELDTSDELFICNSLIGIWPVRQCAERRLAVGPLTQRLLGAVEA